MRKLIYTINVTVDGCCDHTKMVPDEEVLGYGAQLVRDAGLLVYGRKTYQLMVPYWPDIAKASPRQKRISNLLKPLSPRRRLFFHDRWPALNMKIRELLARTFATKYLN
jgi:hypothetical protein